MKKIIKQLSNQRFIITEGKRPIEKRWTTQCNYLHDDNIFQRHLEQGSTYGVITGFNNLIVVDFDCEKVQKELISKFPPTLAVKTASKRLFHLYYRTDNVDTKRINDLSNKRIADIQGQGAMVIGPNSKIGTRQYEVISDKDIAYISKNELLSIFKDYVILDDTRVQKISKKELELFKDPTVMKIKHTLKVKDLLHKLEIPINKNPTECPFHTSVNKACLSYDDELWHCFHCNQGGDVFTLFQKVYNYDFKTAKDVMFKELFLENLKYEEVMKETYSHISTNEKTVTDYYVDFLAKKMVEKYKFITPEETDVIYYYDEKLGIYIPQGETIIKKDFERHFQHYSKTSKVNEVINKVKRLTYNTLTIFNKHLNLLCLDNGVFNLDANILIPHSPEYFFTIHLPIMYNKTARCFAIDKFLNEITLKENIDVLYELPAFCIMGDYRLQKAIMLVGTGKNGKSVYLNLLKHMLGATNISAESLQDLEKSPFSACNLFGKLANIFPDLSTETLTDSSMFKTLTSNHDTISAQHKFKDKFTFVNNAKLIFSCNQPPRTRDVSDAFFRRWQILSFPFAFEGEQEDKMLIDKLTTEEELSGFFNKVLECYYRLSTDNKFSIEMPVDKVRDFYTELSDPVGNFIRLKIEVAPSEGLVKREVYNKFCEYCEEVKIPIFSEKMFSMTLQRKLTIMEYYSATTVEGDVIRQYCWRGITWKPKDNENKDVVIF